MQNLSFLNGYSSTASICLESQRIRATILLTEDNKGHQSITFTRQNAGKLGVNGILLGY